MRLGAIFLLFVFVSVGFIFADTFNNTDSDVVINPFTILYTTFDGITTDFYSYDYSEINDLANVDLERSTYGKIGFEENLDLIAMAGGDSIVDFDTDVNISDNIIYVDNTDLPGINKSVILELYNLSYTDPEIYHNGIICTTCTEISYVGGDIVFSDTEFTGTYYIRETIVPPFCGDNICNGVEDCSSCEVDCGTCSTGGGGGGGGTEPTVPPATNPALGFEVQPWFLELEMEKGTYYRKFFNVTNTGTTDIPITINIEGLTQFIFPEVRGFTVSAGESKTIYFDIYISTQTFADVYTGNINFNSGGLSQVVETVLDVKDRNALFDIRTEVLKKYIYPGGRVRANVSLINMGDLKNFDVSLEYMMIDYLKNEYTVKKEDFAINRTYSNVFYLDVPEDAPIGNYLFYTRVSYGSVNASSYDTFTVETVSTYAWILILWIILILMYLVYRWYKKQRRDLQYKELRDARKKQAEEAVSGNLPQRIMEVPELP